MVATKPWASSVNSNGMRASYNGVPDSLYFLRWQDTTSDAPRSRPARSARRDVVRDSLLQRFEVGIFERRRIERPVPSGVVPEDAGPPPNLAEGRAALRHDDAPRRVSDSVRGENQGQGARILHPVYLVQGRSRGVTSARD